MAHATNDMEAVRMALGMGLVSLVDSLVLGSAAIAFMAYINLKLTLISLWPMPLVAFLTQRLTLHYSISGSSWSRAPFLKLWKRSGRV